jgi:hypothetical protein
MGKSRQFDGQGIARPDIFDRLKNGTVEHADHAERLAETKPLRRRELFIDDASSNCSNRVFRTWLNCCCV